MPEDLRLIIGEEDIRVLVRSIAKDMRADFAGRNPVLIGVLKGAFVFLSDLIREIDMPLEVDFIQTSSYGRRDSPASEVVITRDVTAGISGRDVIIVEGIIDRGRTALALIEHLKAKGPATLALCSLLVRHGATAAVCADYTGAGVGEGFVAGYGMDYKERYRNLPGIYIIAGR